MRNARKDLFFNSILILALIIALLYCQRQKVITKKSIIQEPKFSTAIISKIYTGNTRGGGNKTYVSYIFATQNGKIQRTNMYSTNGRKLNLSRYSYKHFLGKEFPIVYSTQFPDKSHLLFLRYDFHRYGLTFPDSLKWTESFLYENTY